MLVAKLALSGDDKNGPYGRFYFGSGEERSWASIVERLAPMMKVRSRLYFF